MPVSVIGSLSSSTTLGKRIGEWLERWAPNTESGGSIPEERRKLPLVDSAGKNGYLTS